MCFPLRGIRIERGYAEYVCRPAAQLMHVPSDLNAAEAVALVVNYLTAHLALHQTAKVKSGERILVQGAAGGVVGRQAVFVHRILKHEMIQV